MTARICPPEAVIRKHSEHQCQDTEYCYLELLKVLYAVCSMLYAAAALCWYVRELRAIASEFGIQVPAEICNGFCRMRMDESVRFR